MVKKLVLFDVDGTLVESVRLDSDCYVEAIKQVLKLEVDDDWSRYRNITDSGILAEIHRDHFSSDISRETEARFKSCFFSLVEEGLKNGPPLKPLRGAPEVLAYLRSSFEWSFAIAGGAWRDSIALKLHYAGVRMDGIPVFCADDDVSRTAIMGKAIKAMTLEADVEAFPRVVYVGDAVWDVRASRELGIPFVGVGERWKSLRSAGASHAMRDFSDHSRFLNILDQCSAPAG